MVDKCEEPATTVYLTLYHTGSLLVQAQGNKQSNNIHFLNSHLKDLFIEVYEKSKLLPKPLTIQSHKAPLRKLTKTSKNPLKKVKCPKCDYITNITSHLAKHMKKEHGSSIARRLSISCKEDDEEACQPLSSPTSASPCYLCGTVFVSESEMTSNIRTVHELKCTQCSKILYDKFDLNMHMTTHQIQVESVEQDVQVQEQQCDQCDSVFYTTEDLKKHMQCHTKHKKSELHCDFCPYLANNSQDLMVHCKAGNSKYNCKMCSFTSTSHAALIGETNI